MDLDHCLRLLRANSDEEKFVGLYLITKFIKAEPGPTMRSIWESIGPSFLHRMLKTEGSTYSTLASLHSAAIFYDSR
jgi:hypothetical protein